MSKKNYSLFVAIAKLHHTYHLALMVTQVVKFSREGYKITPIIFFEYSANMSKNAKTQAMYTSVTSVEQLNLAESSGE